MGYGVIESIVSIVENKGAHMTSIPLHLMRSNAVPWTIQLDRNGERTKQLGWHKARANTHRGGIGANKIKVRWVV